MDFINYLVNNIPLFCICAVMFFIAFRNYKIRRRESIYFIVFTIIVLFLSVVVFFERYAQKIGNVVIGTVFTSCGYIFRPILLFIFVLLANMEERRSNKFYAIFGTLLIANLIIYIFPLFIGVPGLSTLVFYYQANADGTASFVRGTFLNFFSHAICVVYIAFLLVISTMRFHGKHRQDGLVLVLCAAIIIVTVVAEMITNRNDLLNIVCEICAMINYIFIISVNASKDPLTNLYDRRTFYEDVSKYGSDINGIIQMDMNELKYLNDNYGHGEGDAALKFLASVFEKPLNKTIMCAYRISGDEFVILMFKGTEEQLEKSAKDIKHLLVDSNYSAAVGYYFIKDKNISFDDAMKKAEELMYEDKAHYYEESGHDRRKAK